MQFLVLVALASICQASGEAASDLRNADDLVKHYMEIFKTGNRNAASHLWAKFVLDRAGGMPASQLGQVFRGFCAVSGSPIPDDPQTMYKVKLPRIGGGTTTGVMRHCCWPCICDASDFVRVDTKTIKTSDGNHSFDFLVIGDPCKHPSKLHNQFQDPFSGTNISLLDAAPELECNKDGKLSGAVYSDQGYPIIGMLFTSKQELDAVPMRQSAINPKDPTFGFSGMCQMRQKQGYNSGMGLIFHLVAEINPVPNSAALALPPLEEEVEEELMQKVSASPDHCFGSHAKSKYGELLAYLPAVALVSIAGLVLAYMRAGRKPVPPNELLVDQVELQE